MAKNSLPLIVFDTNALISAAIIPGSISRQALLHAVEHYQLIHSEATWVEFVDVLMRKKFDHYFPDTTRSEFMLMMARNSAILDVSVAISDCPDPKDNKFLELAVEAQSTIIVSGDNHLLNMHPYQGISVLKPADFLRLPN